MKRKTPRRLLVITGTIARRTKDIRCRNAQLSTESWKGTVLLSEEVSVLYSQEGGL
ncbi:MAG TPA: hypothetical protein VEL11_11670 [Candidatus Bathyarchaeia archaeon]|nr:hypothetical protein [Candidatus Bathyarchaeia archaeon]